MASEVVIAIIGSGVLSTLISGLFAFIQQRQNKENCITAGLQQLLYDRLKSLCKSHLQRGYVATNDLDDLERMFKIYHNELNGNGFLDDLMGKVRSLPVKPIMYNDEEGD